MKTNRVSDDIIELLLTSLSVIVIWNRLNVYAFSKFISWSPNIQCDGTWRWGLCYIIQFRWDHEGGTTWWDQCPYNNGEEKKPECSLLAMWGHKEKAAFCKSGRSPDQESNLPAPISWTSQPPELWELNACCLRHAVYVIVISVRAD